MQVPSGSRNQTFVRVQGERIQLTVDAHAIADKLRSAVAEGGAAAPATYFAFQRDCLAVVKASTRTPTAFFVAAGIAAAVADRLESGRGVDQGQAGGLLAYANRLADCLSQHADDANHQDWIDLVSGIYPPDRGH